MQRDPYLVPPGHRKNNKFYIIRGNFDGKPDNEKSTWTADADVAQRMLARIIYDKSRGIQARELKTFDFAAEQYIAWRVNILKREVDRINKLRSYLGDMPVNEISQSDLVAAANSIYQGCKASSKNRSVMRPASAILHYASQQTHKWCDQWNVELFPEDPVKKRTMTIEDARKLVNESSSDKKLFLLWVFKHSDRVTATLEVKGEHIHLDKDYYDRLTGKKKKKWVKAPLDPEVKFCLMHLYGSKLPQGRIFPWNDRWQVYDWTNPLSKSLGVRFTPHMARHSILSWIGDAGGNSIQIKTRGGHASLKSSEPYLAENLEVTRNITAQFVLVNEKPIRLESRGKPRGEKSGKVKKHV